MIQVVLMDGRKFINEHKDFKNDQWQEILDYVHLAINNKDHSIIEISKWKNMERPAKKERIL